MVHRVHLKRTADGPMTLRVLPLTGHADGEEDAFLLFNRLDFKSFSIERCTI